MVPLVQALVRHSTLGVFALAAVACGVRQLPPPPPVPGEPLQVWERDAVSGVGRVIWARNDAATPVTITVLRLFDCRNVRPACGTLTMNIGVRPGETVEVLTLRAANPAVNAGSFMYKFDIEYGWRDSSVARDRIHRP